MGTVSIGSLVRRDLTQGGTSVNPVLTCKGVLVTLLLAGASGACLHASTSAQVDGSCRLMFCAVGDVAVECCTDLLCFCLIDERTLNLK